MASKPRLEFAGAIYHGISRGTYRKPIFEDGAGVAFEKTLFEACAKCGWRLRACVLRRWKQIKAVTPLVLLASGCVGYPPCTLALSFVESQSQSAWALLLRRTWPEARTPASSCHLYFFTAPYGQPLPPGTRNAATQPGGRHALAARNLWHLLQCLSRWARACFSVPRQKPRD